MQDICVEPEKSLGPIQYSICELLRTILVSHFQGPHHKTETTRQHETKNNLKVEEGRRKRDACYRATFASARCLCDAAICLASCSASFGCGLRSCSKNSGCVKHPKASPKLSQQKKNKAPISAVQTCRLAQTCTSRYWQKFCIQNNLEYHYCVLDQVQLLISSAPSETMRSRGAKAGWGKSNLGFTFLFRALSNHLKSTSNPPTGLLPHSWGKTFSLVSAPGNAKIPVWRPRQNTPTCSESMLPLSFCPYLRIY